ncbi:MAG: hypothetical protein WC648_04690 [Candidatus Paceibacterota bacterium]
MTNLCDLKRLREEAMAKGYGSKEWIDCAKEFMDSFPGFYEMARKMNSKFYQLQNQIATGKEIVQAGIELMTPEQVSNWNGVRTFLEQETGDYQDTREE